MVKMATYMLKVFYHNKNKFFKKVRVGKFDA